MLAEKAAQEQNDPALRAIQLSEPLLRWSQQKDFIQMSPQCQNRQQINLAIEKLIEQCPAQLNIVKRLVDLVQDDINRLSRSRSCQSDNSQGRYAGFPEGTGGQHGGIIASRSMSPAQVNADVKSSYSNPSQDQLMPGTLFNFQRQNRGIADSLLGAPANVFGQQATDRMVSFGENNMF
jgi:hypothetical protein